MQFQWDSKTGSYLILQSGVAMGWTDQNSVINYMKELKKRSSKTGREEAQAATNAVVEGAHVGVDVAQGVVVEDAKTGGKEAQAATNAVVEGTHAGVDAAQGAVVEDAKTGGKEAQAATNAVVEGTHAGVDAAQGAVVKRNDDISDNSSNTLWSIDDIKSK